MRTHNFALTAAFLLVVGGLLSSFWAFQKSGLIEERAVLVAGPALVQTAQGANLDASVVAFGKNAAFSSLDSISGLTADIASNVSYPAGAVKDPGYVSLSR